MVTVYAAFGFALWPAFGFGGSTIEKSTPGGIEIDACPICDRCDEDTEKALLGTVQKAGRRKLGIEAEGDDTSTLSRARTLDVDIILGNPMSCYCCSLNKVDELQS